MTPSFHPAMWILALSLGTVGCAGPEASRRTVPSPTPTMVIFQIRAFSDGQQAWRDIWPGDPLRSSDQIGLRVSAGRALYVHIGHSVAANAPTLLLPQGDAVPPALTSGEVLNLPSSGQGLRLDDKPGLEALYVIAAPRALTRQEALSELERAYPIGASRERDPPPIPKERNRIPAILGSIDDRGIAVLRFPYRHE